MKKIIAKITGITLIAALLLPAAVFAAPKADKTPAQNKTGVQAEKKAEREEIKAQRQAEKEEIIKNMTPEERKVLQAEKRAAVKEKVREHRIQKLKEITAKKKANGSDKTPAYQKMLDWLAKLLGINE